MASKLAYKPAAVADALDCSRSTAYDLISRGEIQSFKIGKDTRVTETALKAFLRKQEKKARGR